jgi:orotidine-5'-phosphate decarboxylase
MKKQVIIALDVKERSQALSLIKGIPEAHIFKVGLELFTSEGPALLGLIRDMGKVVFLDLKLHDIPNTVAGAVGSALRHGVRMLTLHASGGTEMMSRAAEAARSASEKEGLSRPLLLAVTVLTSMKSEELQDIGVDADAPGQVLRLARLAKKAGVDGIVCSPQEIEPVRREFGKEWIVVTPGIRPSWAAAQDQKRIMTPAEAVARGADYLVIGRPVTGAPSPREAFLKIIAELESAGNCPERKNCP